ncbi:MAG: S-methyl-5'-thioinosine phosphorylase [Halioglobus sp.]|nr:S-methyl-5'-thioinosine phosphorylase [Halioglobus sp.]
MTALGIIGGTGLEQLAGLESVTEHAVPTPYGEPSQPIREGRIKGSPVFFLHRHGSPGAIPPHLVNYRANVWALQSLGVSRILAVNAVGGISAAMRTGKLVVPDQLVDYTWGREHTFDVGEGGTLQHVDFSEPYDRQLRAELLEAAHRAAIPHESSGVYGVTQGPRLETAAEIQRMARDGCDVVGMTGMPEAGLARELGLAYASVCMVVNPAAGLGDMPLSIDMMRQILQREAGVVCSLIESLLAG